MKEDNEGKVRYRILVSGKQLSLLPKNWRTFVAWLSTEDAIKLIAGVSVLKLFGISIQVERSEN